MKQYDKEERAITEQLARFTGSSCSVKLTDTDLQFRIDSGPTSHCVGGWSGGVEEGSIMRGKIFPRMITGRDPLGSRWWMDTILTVIPWWFE